MNHGATRALLAGLMLALCGCSVATDGSVHDIDREALSPRLLASPLPSSPSLPPFAGRTAEVYFIEGSTGVLLESSRVLAVGSPRVVLQDLLDDLAAGPDPEDRQKGLSTALPPATGLRLTHLSGHQATIDLTVDQPPPDQTIAVAQIVLTATSVTGVRRVRLTINGEPLNAPLASGAQTDRPLTRTDFEQMLVPTTSPPSPRPGHVRGG